MLGSYSYGLLTIGVNFVDVLQTFKILLNLSFKFVRSYYLTYVIIGSDY